MSRKNTILIILISILLIIGGLLFVYFSNNQKTQTQTSETEINPFGNTPENKTPNIPQGQTGQTTGTGGFGTNLTTFSKLKQIYKNPTSGSIFIVDKNNLNILRFVDRAVGHTYEYIALNETNGPIRITNTTIPKIQEAIWAETGNDLVFRFLDGETDNISSFTSKIKIISTSSTEIVGEITGTFLSPNIKQLAISPANNKIFSLIDKSDKSGTIGITTNLDGSSKKIIFDSPIYYWNISWPKESIITFTTKPSYRDNGILFFFNTQSGAMNRILSGYTGLTTLTNKDTSLVAYSYSQNNSVTLDVYDTIGRINKNIKINTISDKCVWGESDSKILYCAIPKSIIPEKYPDSWYQGIISFRDDIWKINTETGTTEKLYDIGSNENTEIDAIDLKISADDNYLAFTNKKDLSLWLLDIK